MQAQREIATRRQHRMHVAGKVCQQPSQLSERLRRGQLVHVVDDQNETAAMVGKLREHPVDHRPPVEVRRPRRRLVPSRAGDLTHRGKQGQPELLSVVLVALHLQDGEPVRLTRPVGPGAQQRRLPAAAGAEMIVTFRAAARSRVARRSPRPISWGAAGATVRGLPRCPRRTPCRRRHSLLAISPAHAVSTAITRIR